MCSCVPEEKKPFVGEVGDEEIETAVVVDVTQVRPHRRHGCAELVERHTPRRGDVLERAIAAIAKQEIRLRIVRHEHVRPSIVVHIPNGRTHALSEMTPDV